jgi:hypothetical protein
MNTTNFELIEWTKEKINENVASIDMGHDSWKMRCPFCGDSKKKSGKKRGNYYLKDGMFKCFNGGCEKYCNSFILVAELTGKTLADVKAEFFKYEHGGGGNFEYIQTFEEEVTKATPSDDFVIPAEWVGIEDKPRQYIDERMISKAPNVNGHWTMYYNTVSKRLVIPWIERGKIVYYQERALYPDQQPKYLFPKNVTQRPLFGIDNIDASYPYIFYLEGALDSIWVKNGVAAGSISLSGSQMDTLSNFVGHQIVYFPDNPWVDSASLENIRKLCDKQKDLLVWMWPKNFVEKDVNEVVCRFGATELFFHEQLHQNIVSVQKARCMLELMN